MKRPAQHTAAAVADWLREGRRVVAGLLVEAEGSSPLDVGASMYVDDQGHIEGSITGGCVEGAVAATAMEILENGGAPPPAGPRESRQVRRSRGGGGGGAS